MSAEQDSGDRQNVGGTHHISELRFNLTSSDPYSTQKIIEAKALATDDSELIEAAKENTKQVQSYVRSDSVCFKAFFNQLKNGV